METKLSDKKMRQKNLMLVIAIIAVSGVIYLCFVRFLNVRIPCNLRRLTGLLCPGCGMTRAVFSILRLDFGAAFRYNALSLTLMPLAALYGVFRAYKYVTEENYKTRLWEYFLWAGFVVWILVFTVSRNLH